jgi:hypothetical protein
VIDASIAAAAGDGAHHPVSKHCREFLVAVLEICHRAAFCRELLSEWKDHETSFALKWRRQMVSKKKMVSSDACQISELRSAIEESGLGHRQQRAMAKDCHLIGLALALGAPVASCDEEARGLFGLLSRSDETVAAIVWINPAKEQEQAVAWLQAGAPQEQTRTLGAT